MRLKDNVVDFEPSSHLGGRLDDTLKKGRGVEEDWNHSRFQQQASYLPREACLSILRGWGGEGVLLFVPLI